jgi:hypothetical protein
MKDNMNPFLVNLKDAQDKFNKEFPSMFEDMMNKNEISKINLKKNVKKVSFVPLKLNSNGDPYVILGKHTRRKRKDQFNFLGGGTGSNEWKEWISKPHEERVHIVSNTLFIEVYEEFHIMLTCENLRKCLIDVKRADTFLLFYVHIDNIDYEDWTNNQNDIMSYREISLPYKEISTIDEFSLEFIQSEYDRLKDPSTGKFEFYVIGERLKVSRYVISMVRQMTKVCEKLNSNEPIDFKEFATIPIQKVFEACDHNENELFEYKSIVLT